MTPGKATLPGNGKSWLTPSLLLFVLILHGWVNTFHIGDKFFWVDESSTYEIAAQPFAQIVPALSRSHLQPPLFYWLAHFVIDLGDSPVVLRGISFGLIAFTLAFVMLGLRELTLASRLLLSTLLVLSPFTAYVATEFRPYALAVFFILVSSVLLFRAMPPTGRWSPAAWYGLSALGLQYSLLLNCWVFMCQMLVVGVVVFDAARRRGMRSAFQDHGRLIIVCAILGTVYAFFLAWIAAAGHAWSLRADLLEKWSLWGRLMENGRTALLPGVTAIRGFAGWPSWIAIGLFLCGVILTLRRQFLLAFYLISLFIGQLIFSTYLLYARISWFHFRYLTASFVAFLLLAALGYEYLVARRWPGRRELAAPFVLLMLAFPIAFDAFHRLRQMPRVANPYRILLEDTACPSRETLVYCLPHWSCSPVAYEFRRDAEIAVPATLSTAEVNVARDRGQCVFVLVWRTEWSARALETSLGFPESSDGFSRTAVDLSLRYPALTRFNQFPDYLYMYRPEGAQLRP
jgi:hypothetical protein